MIHLPYLRPLFALLRLACVGLHLLYGAMQVALVFPWLSNQHRRQRKKRWSQQLLSWLGIRIHSEQPLPDLANLVVSNHVSFVDIFVINALAPAAFVCKDDVARWPLIGWLCRNTETVFMARGSRAAAHRTHLHMVSRLAAGERIAVFPEGTTTNGEQVLPFHAALFQSAIDAGVSVSCVALSYHDAQGQPSSAAAYIDNISLLQCLHRIASAGPLEVRVKTLAPLRGLHDRRHLAKHAHQHIDQALSGLRLSPA
jgi:1-acyl-sn-glycerol-3-phosphate acyltransferase